MTTPDDILARVRATGATLELKPDGTGIKARHILVGLLEEVRAHKAEIMALLKAEQETPRTYSRLELANQVLEAVIRDEQQRRKIRALAESDAKHWRFLGADGYQHVLSNDIIDSVEQATGKLICFRCNANNDFVGWFFKELP